MNTWLHLHTARAGCTVFSFGLPFHGVSNRLTCSVLKAQNERKKLTWKCILIAWTPAWRGNTLHWLRRNLEPLEMAVQMCSNGYMIVFTCYIFSVIWNRTPIAELLFSFSLTNSKNLWSGNFTFRPRRQLRQFSQARCISGRSSQSHLSCLPWAPDAKQGSRREEKKEKEENDCSI